VSFSSVVHKAWQRNQLFSALIELTYRCNLDCYFCYNDLSLRGQPLSRDQYFELLEGLRALGALNVVLSGGEPLAHPDFFEIGRRARELGFVTRVKSNGHALGRAVARRIREEVDPFVVELSLHGATAPTHDRQTRVPGSFDRLLENIGEAREAGLRLQINSTLTGWNEHELTQMIALVESLGIRMQIDPEVSPKDDGDSEPLSIRASREAVQQLFRLQAEQGERAASTGAGLGVVREGDDLLPEATPASRSSKHCAAGSATIAVDPFGSVFPCVQWRRAVGNLHEHSIETIWGGAPELDEVRRTTEEVKAMIQSGGGARALMSFCPGAAESQTGSPLGLYPAAAARKGLREEAMSVSSSRMLPIVD
jgi:MoaA/NifB/PqqE/SkfB family radical SAM enzyme